MKEEKINNEKNDMENIHQYLVKLNREGRDAMNYLLYAKKKIL